MVPSNTNKLDFEFDHIFKCIRYKLIEILAMGFSYKY